jgi:toxin-antitoxin system PIN domain toxin
MQLPDVNVWLGLTFDSHVHHPTAKKWFDSLSTELCHFCRMTQQGFLRLATNPAVFGAHALTLTEAWEKYDLFQSDLRVAYIDEPAGIEALWRTHTQRRTFSPKVWNDAYLAAFAQVADFELVTIDRAFSQYANLRCTILS